MTELYTEGDVLRLHRKIAIWTAALGVFGLAALAACIISAATATTLTAERNEVAAIIISSLSGWVIIYCAIFIIGGARKESGHAKTLIDGERERVEGKISLNGERLKIKKSVAVRGVEVVTPDGTKRFWISESRVKKFKKAEPTAIYISHGYVAAYEERL